MMKDDLLFYSAYENFYDMAKNSSSFKSYCIDAFGADFSQDGFSDLSQINQIIEHIPQSDDLHILDIGCGNGKMLKYLQSKTSAFIHGFDYSENAIADAKSYNNCCCDFQVGIIGEISYKSQSFDMVISMDTMYFAQDMTVFVSQIRDWLKPNGILYIGYQEGDIMPKTAHGNSTAIAKALMENGFRFEINDITRSTYELLLKKRNSVIAHKTDFINEGLEVWYQMVLDQTNCVSEPIEEYIKNNARYIYIAR